jgi:amino acid adenylation domain-containing protein
MTPMCESAGGPLEPDRWQSVCALFERQVDRTPDAVALMCEGRSLTYRELDARANQLAHHLGARLKVGPESIVALLVGRSERMLISILSVLKAGGAYLPISPEYPANRIAYILRDARPALVLTEQRYVSLMSGFTGTRLSWDDPSASWTDEPTDRPCARPGPRQLVYIMYTSGSTGYPKGVMLEHRNLSNFILWCHDEYRNSNFDIVYAGTPFGFDLSNIELYFPLSIGRPIRLLPSSQAMGLYLRRDRNVLINTVPSLAQAMLRTEAIFQNVSVLNLGGEAIPPSLARALRAYPHMEIRNMYGPTETTSTAINYRMDEAASPEILIGKPIANTVVHIVDEELRQVPVGVKGEICIGGHGLARGYWNRPELTRERFIYNPFRSGERLYRTGDLGIYLADGNIRFLGRNDNQIKVRGFRVELDEIASQLARHPEVRDAVVGVRGADAGDRIVAVVGSSVGGVNAKILTAFLQDNLPPYMIPDEIVVVETFPLTPTGKIDRRALFADGPLVKGSATRRREDP